jgi:hypothetical protein
MSTEVDSSHTSELRAAAEGHLQSLSKALFEGRKPPPGAYAIFYEIGNTLEKLETCYLLTERLFEQAARADQALKAEVASRPRDRTAAAPGSDDVQKVTRQSRMLSIQMRIDFESLYMFGGVLLDQWALVAARVGSLPIKGKHPFRELVVMLESGTFGDLRTLWSVARKEALWLHYHVRHYRNCFVVHGNRPWQRGTSQVLGRVDFRLFTPTPIGWNDEADLDRKIVDLVPFAPEHIRDSWAGGGPRGLLRMLFEEIASIERADVRERVARLYGEIGGSTPSFQEIARRLLEFIGRGTLLLQEVARERVGTIDLGTPHKLGEEIERMPADNPLKGA